MDSKHNIGKDEKSVIDVKISPENKKENGDDDEKYDSVIINFSEGKSLTLPKIFLRRFGITQEKLLKNKSIDLSTIKIKDFVELFEEMNSAVAINLVDHKKKEIIQYLKTDEDVLEVVKKITNYVREIIYNKISEYLKDELFCSILLYGITQYTASDYLKRDVYQLNYDVGCHNVICCTIAITKDEHNYITQLRGKYILSKIFGAFSEYRTYTGISKTNNQDKIFTVDLLKKDILTLKIINKKDCKIKIRRCTLSISNCSSSIIVVISLENKTDYDT